MFLGWSALSHFSRVDPRAAGAATGVQGPSLPREALASIRCSSPPVCRLYSARDSSRASSLVSVRQARVPSARDTVSTRSKSGLWRPPSGTTHDPGRRDRDAAATLGPLGVVGCNHGSTSFEKFSLGPVEQLFEHQVPRVAPMQQACEQAHRAGDGQAGPRAVIVEVHVDRAIDGLHFVAVPPSRAAARCGPPAKNGQHDFAHRAQPWKSPGRRPLQRRPLEAR